MEKNQIWRGMKMILMMKYRNGKLNFELVYAGSWHDEVDNVYEEL